MARPWRGRWRGIAQHVHEPPRACGHDRATGQPPPPVTSPSLSGQPAWLRYVPSPTWRRGTSCRCGVRMPPAQGWCRVLRCREESGRIWTRCRFAQGVIAGPSARGIRPRDLPAGGPGPRRSRGRNRPSSCSASDFPCSCSRAGPGTLCTPPRTLCTPPLPKAHPTQVPHAHPMWFVLRLISSSRRTLVDSCTLLLNFWGQSKAEPCPPHTPPRPPGYPPSPPQAPHLPRDTRLQEAAQFLDVGVGGALHLEPLLGGDDDGEGGCWWYRHGSTAPPLPSRTTSWPPQSPTWSQMRSHFFSLSYWRRSRALSGGRFMELWGQSGGRHPKGHRDADPPRGHPILWHSQGPPPRAPRPVAQPGSPPRAPGSMARPGSLALGSTGGDGATRVARGWQYHRGHVPAAGSTKSPQRRHVVPVCTHFLAAGKPQPPFSDRGTKLGSDARLVGALGIFMAERGDRW